MLEFCSLASGSSGNCLYVASPAAALLIDCGISGKKVLERLDEIDADLSKFKGILITHDHKDHIGCVGVISRKLGIPVYATKPTLNSILSSDCNIKNFKVAEESFCIEDICIKMVKTSHDAPDSHGYIFTHEDSKISVMTDLGFVTNDIIEECASSSFAFIEANYDPKMLMYGSYPPETKRRIASEIGHLSNDDCAKFVCSLAKLGTKKFMLGHISSENNMTTLALNTVKDALDFMGINTDDFYISVATKYDKSDYIKV